MSEKEIKRMIDDLELFCDEVYERPKDKYYRIFEDVGIDII